MASANIFRGLIKYSFIIGSRIRTINNLINTIKLQHSLLNCDVILPSLYLKVVN